ncbi:MAG: DUF4160 domain-containing protein [Acidobacteria bacterium]|nr:DUF4160 domain-containing protein [Acidobacteriota bacterium]
MPTIKRIGPYRFYFFSHEPNEPPHVHIDRDDQTAKFWLQPVSLASNLGFNARELKRLEAYVEEFQLDFTEAWHDHFGTGN